MSLVKDYLMFQGNVSLKIKDTPGTVLGAGDTMDKINPQPSGSIQLYWVPQTNKCGVSTSDTKKNKAVGAYKVMWKKRGCYFREGGLGILFRRWDIWEATWMRSRRESRVDLEQGCSWQKEQLPWWKVVSRSKSSKKGRITGTGWAGDQGRGRKGV